MAYANPLARSELLASDHMAVSLSFRIRSSLQVSLRITPIASYSGTVPVAVRGCPDENNASESGKQDQQLEFFHASKLRTRMRWPGPMVCRRRKSPSKESAKLARSALCAMLPLTESSQNRALPYACVYSEVSNISRRAPIVSVSIV